MASLIDPTKPAEEGKPLKADQRANWVAANVEMDHGGFLVGITPVNYTAPATDKVSDHISKIDERLGEIEVGGVGGGGGDVLGYGGDSIGY